MCTLAIPKTPPPTNTLHSRPSKSKEDAYRRTPGGATARKATARSLMASDLTQEWTRKGEEWTEVDGGDGCMSETSDGLPNPHLPIRTFLPNETKTGIKCSSTQETKASSRSQKPTQPTKEKKTSTKRKGERERKSTNTHLGALTSAPASINNFTTNSFPPEQAA